MLNNILCPQKQGSLGLGFPWAVAIPAIASVLVAGGTVAATAINARAQKKSNEAAKELAKMQLEAQRQSTASYDSYFSQFGGGNSNSNSNNNQTQQPVQQQDNTLLYAAMIGLAVLILMKR